MQREQREQTAATTGHGESSTTGAIENARRVVLARRRLDTATHADSEAHLLAIPLSGDHGTATAICGLRLPADDLETVTPGAGRWCTMCFVSHVTGSSPVLAPSPYTGSGCRSAGTAYRELGWPVTVRGEGVSVNLDLDVDAAAFVIPAVLAAEVADVLVRRRCAPPVLAHPALPAHRVILAGERFPVALGWPTGVHRITGTVMLPPTVTAHGPIQWVRPPQPNSLRLCREIDVLTALRTALHEPPRPSTPASR